MTLVRKHGWLKIPGILLSGLMLLWVSMQIGGNIRGNIDSSMDTKIEVHRLSSEIIFDEKIDEIQKQQIVTDTKLDMILERLPE